MCDSEHWPCGGGAGLYVRYRTAPLVAGRYGGLRVHRAERWNRGLNNGSPAGTAGAGGAMTMLEIKGNEVKILWICALFGLLSVVAYGRVATTLDERALAHTEMRMARAGGMLPALAAGPDIPGGMSRTAARSAPAAYTEASPVAPGLAVYLQLHETRAADAFEAPARANLCPG